ncbi:hypothetical protein D3C72_2247560 [compost metagenome]
MLVGEAETCLEHDAQGRCKGDRHEAVCLRQIVGGSVLTGACAAGYSNQHGISSVEVVCLTAFEVGYSGVESQPRVLAAALGLEVGAA